MRRLTVSELLTATGGTLLAGGVSAAVTSVSTDSRKAGEGALFIPLTGERFDGHDYIDKALALGAAGCLCARTPAAFLPDNSTSPSPIRALRSRRSHRGTAGSLTSPLSRSPARSARPRRRK